MYIKISLAVKNSVDISQIDESIRKMINETDGDSTVALDIKKEFNAIVSGLSMGKDSNGNKIETLVTGVEVYTGEDRTQLISSWHDKG